MSNFLSNEELIQQYTAELSCAQAQMVENCKQEVFATLADVIDLMDETGDFTDEVDRTNFRAEPEVIDLTEDDVRPEPEVIDLTDDDWFDLLNNDLLNPSDKYRFMRRLEQVDLFGSNQEYEQVEAECVAEAKQLLAQRQIETF
jgi:hypothetical protein